MLIVSTTAFNQWPVGLVVVVPITSRHRGFAHHVPLAGGGPDRASFAMPEYVRSVGQRRLRRRLGMVDRATLEAVTGWVRRIVAL